EHNLGEVVLRPIHAPVPGPLTNLCAAITIVKAVSQMNQEPIRVPANRHSPIEQKKRSHMIFALKVEMWDPVKPAPEIGVYVDPEGLPFFPKPLGGCHITVDLATADLFSNSAPLLKGILSS